MRNPSRFFQSMEDGNYVEEVTDPVPRDSPIQRANNDLAENVLSVRNEDVASTMRGETWLEFFQRTEDRNYVEEVTAPVPRDSPIQRANNDLEENVPSVRNEDVPGTMRGETWLEFFQRMEDRNYVEEVTAPVPRDSPIQRANNDLEENVPSVRNEDVPGTMRGETWLEFFQRMEDRNYVVEVTAAVPRDSPIQRANNDLEENVPSVRNEDVPGTMRGETWLEFFQRMEDRNYVVEVTAAVPRDSPIQRANNDLAEIVEVCIICFDEETNVTLRPCNHTFCNTCTIKLIEDNFNTCPLCRASILAYDGIHL